MRAHPVSQHNDTETATFIAAVKDGISEADAGRMVHIPPFGNGFYHGEPNTKNRRQT